MEAPFTRDTDPYTYVAVVTPMTDDPATSGKIKWLACAPTVKHKWLQMMVVSADKADWVISPIFQRRGFLLLRDLFSYEGRMEDWDLAVECRRRNKPFPKDKLPKEVLRRQACGRDEGERVPTAAEARAKARG